MFPGMGGINPQQMQRMMAQMGIKTSEIKSTKVIIETPEGNLVIESPQITKMTIQGTDTYQIIGKATLNSTQKPLFSEEDIGIVASESNVTKERAKDALEKNDGDIAKAIISLQR